MSARPATASSQPVSQPDRVGARRRSPHLSELACEELLPASCSVCSVQAAEILHSPRQRCSADMPERRATAAAGAALLARLRLSCSVPGACQELVPCLMQHVSCRGLESLRRRSTDVPEGLLPPPALAPGGSPAPAGTPQPAASQRAWYRGVRWAQCPTWQAWVTAPCQPLARAPWQQLDGVLSHPSWSSDAVWLGHAVSVPAHAPGGEDALLWDEAGLCVQGAPPLRPWPSWRSASTRASRRSSCPGRCRRTQG